MRNLNKTLILFTLVLTTQAALSDYFSGITQYLGFKQNEEGGYIEDIYTQKVPYEVSIVDEKFLSEAAKLTGVTLSDLDSCQHRVVLKLKTDCDKLNDEQLAKMAVHLLNCQSFVEGRQIFPCNDEMSIKACTTNMDADTWTSYHLMSNRVRAVCYSVRQTQFRGLAEHTVNRLMGAAQDQLKTLGKISGNQEKLKVLAESTYDTLTKGHENLSRQQKDLQKAQFHGQLMVEDNIQKLIDEKRLILETQNQLHEMTSIVHDKLENSLKQLEDQTDESRVNHRELIKDLVEIQMKTKEIFQKIDESSSLLIKQNEEFKNQYKSTFENLQEVNKTVHNLVILVGGTRQALEDRLVWITSALGGTDLALERIHLILWHVALMLIAMLTCAFLSARASTRLLVALLPPVNLGIALYGQQEHLDFLSLVGAIIAFVVIQTVIISAISLRTTVKAAIPWVKLSPDKSKTKSEEMITTSFREPSVDNFKDTTSHVSSRLSLNNQEEEEDAQNETTDTFKEYDFTPPLSRNGYYPLSSKSRSRSNTPLRLNSFIASQKSGCKAKTRAGTPCKLSALLGRDYCHRHQHGDSVMG